MSKSEDLKIAEPRRFKRKEFISFLQEAVNDFTKPSVKLEQYMTPYDVTADFFALLNNSMEIAGKVVADFCCGTGLYSAASYFLDAKEIYSFEIDTDAINSCKETMESFEDCVSHVEQVDLTNPAMIEKYSGSFDTVIMNPPFGTKDNEGIDMQLLKTAICVILAIPTIYSAAKEAYIHCTSQ